LCSLSEIVDKKRKMNNKYGGGGFENGEEEMMISFRKFLPHETQDQIASIIVFVVLPLGFLFELFVILPSYHPLFSEGWTMRVVVLSLLGLNAYLNIYKMISIGPNGKNSQLPAIIKPGFRYCHDCKLNVPQRSFHCPVCDKCIFRRDHHCSFGAVCIGHFNQRYFIAAILQFWIISITVTSWNWHWMWSQLGGYNGTRLWILVIPHIAWFFRALSMFDFLSVMVFVFSATVLFFNTYLVGSQMFCIVRGQTRVEYLMDIHAYNVGVYANFRQIMGRRWPLALVSPFFASPLDSDGLSFPVRESLSVHNNVKSL